MVYQECKYRIICCELSLSDSHCEEVSDNFRELHILATCSNSIVYEHIYKVSSYLSALTQYDKYILSEKQKYYIINI